jgi:hypothetical protein
MTSWEATSPALLARLPALIRASLDASTPPATVKRKLELIFREEPGLPPSDAAIPVEIIAGVWDLVTPLAGVRRLAARIPGRQASGVGILGTRRRVRAAARSPRRGHRGAQAVVVTRY